MIGIGTGPPKIGLWREELDGLLPANEGKVPQPRGVDDHG
ncbi:hypothetical protein [Azospirillum endophyticum]